MAIPPAEAPPSSRKSRWLSLAPCQFFCGIVLLITGAYLLRMKPIKPPYLLPTGLTLCLLGVVFLVSTLAAVAYIAVMSANPGARRLAYYNSERLRGKAMRRPRKLRSNTVWSITERRADVAYSPPGGQPPGPKRQRGFSVQSNISTCSSTRTMLEMKKSSSNPLGRW